MSTYQMVGKKILGDDYAEGCRAANDYSVSLVNGNDLKGSATLVSIGNICGLLTADHVWEALRQGEAEDHFCMVLGNQLQRFEYSFQECTPVVVGRFSQEHEEEGPDLTFIRLHNLLKLATIKSGKSFYPLQSENYEMFRAIPYDKCPWLVWGAPEEKTYKTATSAGEPFVKLAHFAGGGEFLEWNERAAFDYVKVKIPCGISNFPDDYGGVSGGGAWIPIRMSENPEGTVLKPAVHLLLAGVAYFQSEKVGEHKTLTLHGPKSIYEKLVREVHETFAE